MIETIRTFLRKWILWIELSYVMEWEVYDTMRMMSMENIDKTQALIKNFIFVMTNKHIEHIINRSQSKDESWCRDDHEEKVKWLLELYNAFELFKKEKVSKK